jgi:integrase
MKLTQRRIEDLECPASKKDVLVFDDEQAGLGVRVMRSAKKGSMDGKSYLAQYRHAGQKRRVPLGSCSAIKLAAARDAVKVILGDVAKGRDPATERKYAAREAKRKAAHDALTLSALLDQWDSLHLANRRERYAAEAVRSIKSAFGDQLGSPAGDLSRAVVVRVLDGLAKDGKVATASATARYGRACFQWAVKRGSLELNPFANLPVAPVAKRERVLTDDELRSVWAATEEMGSFNSIVRMLILTGQRREEVACMVWDEVSPNLSTWTIPGARAKNGAAHIVPLSAQAQEALKRAPRFAKKDDAPNAEAEAEAEAEADDKPDIVFPGDRGVFSGWSKSKERLDTRSGVSRWTLHDLRRTMATGLQTLGVRLEVTEAVLNHVSGSRVGIVGVYQRHEWANEKREALKAWGAHVAATVKKRKAADNATPLRRSA